MQRNRLIGWTPLPFPLPLCEMLSSPSLPYPALHEGIDMMIGRSDPSSLPLQTRTSLFSLFFESGNLVVAVASPPSPLSPFFSTLSWRISPFFFFDSLLIRQALSPISSSFSLLPFFPTHVGFGSLFLSSPPSSLRSWKEEWISSSPLFFPTRPGSFFFREEDIKHLEKRRTFESLFPPPS